MNVVQDNYRHQGMRRRRVELWKGRGIKNERGLGAIGQVPRHLFIPPAAFREPASADLDLPIPCGPTLCPPYTVAFQTDMLHLAPGCKVLEVGTGSVEGTDVLAALGAKVFSIERHRPLYLQTKDRLARLGYKSNTYHGDGYKGLPKEAPFDRILVTCGAAAVPDTLVSQLTMGGRMVVPVGEGDVQRMMVIDRRPTGIISIDHGAFRFVPMLEDKTG